jgi:hypothetical protein
MANITTSNVYRDRMDFAKIHTSIPIPNLIEVQRKSYHRFLQMDVPPSEREDVGLQAVFNSLSQPLKWSRAGMRSKPRAVKCAPSAVAARDAAIARDLDVPTRQAPEAPSAHPVACGRQSLAPERSEPRRQEIIAPVRPSTDAIRGGSCIVPGEGRHGTR